RKMYDTIEDVDAIKQRLIVAGKQVYDDGKSIYYVDYSGRPVRMKRERY
ncbi:hypothetical protein LCGC14_2183990, partial [marine sediment metagenome]